MFISKAKKYHEEEDGTIVAYDYYRLTKSFRDAAGKKFNRSVLCLGMLDGFTKEERNELADMLTTMIEKGESVMHENRKLYEAAMQFYVKYRESKYAREHDEKLKAEYERAKEERLKDQVTVKINTLTQHTARNVGRESLCRSTLDLLGIRQFLSSLQDWTSEQVDLALMQIVARSIYPYSELKTVRYLHENSALLEMFHIKKESVTKDALYKSAQRLWDVHSQLEDFLHQRVCDLFDIEEKILLFDITNAYFEGRYDGSELCKYGRSKEKRNDCKVVVLAAVVNTDGLLVRTSIYEGNKADSTTLKDVIGSLSGKLSTGPRKIVVMDAGFYTSSNIQWLKDKGYDYITVLPSGTSKFKASSSNVINHKDCRNQQIRLQLGTVEIDGKETKALLVDSDAKALKEHSMYDRACQCYEEGLEAIKAGIEKKGGTKKRDAVNRRLGKLDDKYGAIRKSYSITFKYDGKEKEEKVVSMSWERNGKKSEDIQEMHGKYVLLTSLDENDEVNIWRFYNVIRTVEETFHILKTDLDIRPVFHKSDDGIKAHLNLSVLAYWIVSVTKYRLRIKGRDNVRWDEIMRIASTQVMVTARVETAGGNIISIRQSTVAEDKLAEIYQLLDTSPIPIKKQKSVVHPNPDLKNPDIGNQGVT